MTARCAFCGTTSQLDAHHVTGRPAPGLDYIDPALLLWLCRQHHTGVEGVHPVLRVVDLDFLPPGRHPLAHRLRRVAVHSRLTADVGRPFVLDPGPSVALAGLLREAADVIERGRRP